MPPRPIPPLLLEPAPPFLESQAAFAQGADELSELAQWRYRLRYRAEHLAQDDVVVTVSFNVPPEGDMNAAATPPPRADERFRVQLDYGDDGEQLRALRLVRERNAGTHAADWPEVELGAASDAAVDLGHGEGDDDMTRTYVLDSPLPPLDWPRIGLTWNRLATSALQNARASLAVVRNGHLGEPVAEEHIYRSATTQAANAAVPLNRWTQDIPIRDLGISLEAALDTLFVRLFGEGRIGQRVTVQLSYGYPLAPAGAGDAFMNYLPVMLLPFGPITAALASTIAAAAADWQEAYRPPTQGAEWLIALVQFSRLDAHAPQPLLEITRLIYRV